MSMKKSSTSRSEIGASVLVVERGDRKSGDSDSKLRVGDDIGGVMTHSTALGSAPIVSSDIAAPKPNHVPILCIPAEDSSRGQKILMIKSLTQSCYSKIQEVLHNI